jgi:tetratricopeptide (TPR) repeat protein
MIRHLAAAMLAAAFASPALAQGGDGRLSGGGSKDLARTDTIDPTALYRQAVDYIQAKDFNRAIFLLRQVLERREGDPASNFMMGVAQLGLNDLAEARRFLVRAVSEKPDFADALGRLGWVEARLGNGAEAQKRRAVLAGLKTSCAAACPEAAAIDAAIATIDSAAPRPAISAATLFNQGIDHINAKAYAEAIAAFDGVLAQKPDDYEAAFLKGQAQSARGDYAGAKTSLEAALKLQPGLVDAKGRLGWVEMQLGNTAAAASIRADLEAIKAKAPNAAAQIDAAIRLIDAP